MVDDKVKLGAVLLGGYVLGRTKKGGTALRLAMQMSGYKPTDLAKAGGQSAIQNEQVAKLLEQLRGPVQQMLTQALDAQVANVTSRIAARTEKLSSVGTQATDTATGTADTVKGVVTGKEEEEPEEPEEEEEEPEDEETEDDEDPEVQERVKELKGTHTNTLRKMARDLGFADKDLEGLDKSTLSEEIAYAEAEDAAKKDEEPEPEEEEPEEEEPEPEPEPKPAKKTAKKAPAKKTAKKSSRS